MLIKTLPVGDLETNCYIVTNEATLHSVVIDPGDESNTIIGICKTDAEDPFGIAIKMQENGGVKGTGHRNVLDKIVQALPYIIDLDNENFTFYRGFKADEYVCFETKSSVKKPIKRRKK